MLHRKCQKTNKLDNSLKVNDEVKVMDKKKTSKEVLNVCITDDEKTKISEGTFSVTHCVNLYNSFAYLLR